MTIDDENVCDICGCKIGNHAAHELWHRNRGEIVEYR